MSFCFIHAADLHLDSPFQGVTTDAPKVAVLLRQATFDAYERLVDLCVERDALFLAIAGDVYDGADRNLRAQLRFFDGVQRLDQHGIHTFVTHGNHDALDGWSSSFSWPSRAHIFGAEEVETFTVGNDDQVEVAVSGISYRTRKEKRKLASAFHATNPELFQVALLHCSCGTSTEHETYSPCSLDDLVGRGFDYWALGHVHNRQVMHTSPWVVYSGNTQGRSIREPGPRGCTVVTVGDDGDVDLEFVPLDAVRWLSEKVDIADLDSLDALDRALAEAIERMREEGEGRPVIGQVALTGRGPLFHDLLREDNAQELLDRHREAGLDDDPLAWIQKLENRCGPEVDLEKRREASDLLGQLLSISHGLRTGHDIGEELAPALALLHENCRASNALKRLPPADLEGVLAQAELLCVDSLQASE